MDAARPHRVTASPGAIRAALGVLVLALVITTGYLAYDQRRALAAQREADAADAAAVEAATALARAWTTIDYRKPEAYFASIKKKAGGDFLAELEETEETLTKLLTTSKTVQTANIPTDGAALVERNGARATVLVTVDASVKTAAAPDPTVRQYRLRMTLARHDAEWHTTGLEFVG